MDKALERRLNQLVKDNHQDVLSSIRVGLERETLRVDANGEPSTKNHPEALGSALTHPSITTDYAESLLEFVTSPCTSVEGAATQLETLMRFAARRLGDEVLWSASMPCRFNRKDAIRIAEYGTSNLGKFKHLYRIGLAYRYGKAMQMIAGIHFNFSFTDSAWDALAALDGQPNSSEYRTTRYLDMMRNLQRSRFLVPYLFGVAPAVDRSYFIDTTDRLPPLDDETRFLPFGTTLRLSSIGYSNRRCGAYLPINTIDGFLGSLSRALTTPCPAFVAIGVKVDGEFRQINANVLQTENEYYASVRPKQPPGSGQTHAQAIREKGIGYVEMRLLDVSPYSPIGVDLDTLRFVQAWMTTCFLRTSLPISLAESHYSDQNLLMVAMDGQQTDQRLTQKDGERTTQRKALTRFLDEIEPVCALLGPAYQESLARQRAKLDDSALLPSTRMLQEMRVYGETFQQFGMRYAQQHTKNLATAPIAPDVEQQMKSLARASIAEQHSLEKADNVSFETYLAQTQDV